MTTATESGTVTVNRKQREPMGFFLTDETTVKPLPRRKTPVLRRRNSSPANRHKCTESPFGVLIAEWGPAKDACPFRFMTKYYDAEIEGYNFGYREYIPATGKWLSRDPLPERIDEPNTTAAFRNDPVNNTDPDGRAVRMPEATASVMAQLLGEENLTFVAGPMPGYIQLRIDTMDQYLAAKKNFESGSSAMKAEDRAFADSLLKAMRSSANHLWQGGLSSRVLAQDTEWDRMEGYLPVRFFDTYAAWRERMNDATYYGAVHDQSRIVALAALRTLGAVNDDLLTQSVRVDAAKALKKGSHVVAYTACLLQVWNIMAQARLVYTTPLVADTPYANAAAIQEINAAWLAGDLAIQRAYFIEAGLVATMASMNVDQTGLLESVADQYSGEDHLKQIRALYLMIWLDYLHYHRRQALAQDALQK